MTRPKWSKEKERVVRAAMRWSDVQPRNYLQCPASTESKAVFKACAAASKRRKP